MSKSINFVGDRRKRLTKTQKQDKKIMGIMINVVIAIFAIFLIVLGLRVFYVFRVKSVKDEQISVKNIILSHESVEKEYIIFAQKLKKLAVFFGKRKDKQEALVFFSEVFGDEVIVSGIDYSSSDEDVVSFVIKAPNIFVMERVFTTIDSVDVASKYPNITKKNMRRSSTGNYTVDLTVILVAEADLVGSQPVSPNSEGIQ
ncbi:MAG: hypothetical protein H6772_04575 [Pseudomonadales bacterium]|nr:hypothetical protein [Pseudomonadales bacterium]